MLRKIFALNALVFAILVPFALLTSPAGGQTATEPPRWVFEPPPPQADLNRDFQEVATLTVKVGAEHTLCWYNPNNRLVGTKTVEDTAMQMAFRRYRVEGGKTETSVVKQYADWTPEKDATGAVIPRSYCTKAAGIPRAGHWVFEAQMCRVPYVSDAESCSGWMSSIQRYTDSGGGGTLDGTPRGWWIYVYLPAPSGIGT